MSKKMGLCSNSAISRLFVDESLKHDYSAELIFFLIFIFSKFEFPEIGDVMVEMVSGRTANFQKTVHEMTKRGDICMMQFASSLDIFKHKFQLSQREVTLAKNFFAIVINIIYEQRACERQA